MLQLRNITKIFNKDTPGEVTALKDICLDVKSGSFVTIIGSNGSGKTTLLNAIVGTFPLDKGSIAIDKRDITDLPEHVRSRFIGRVFQNPAMGTAPSMSIEENLAIASIRGRRPSLRIGVTKRRREIFRLMLSELALDSTIHLSEPVNLLSGGERQALTMLIATMNHPKLLLLDEHCASLDPRMAVITMEMTERIVVKNHLTTLMITHNIAQALKYGDRMIMLHRGAIILDVNREEKEKLTTSEVIDRFKEVTAGPSIRDKALLG